MSVARLHAVTKSVSGSPHGTPGVDDVSFSFPVGQFTSILGNSASSNSLLIDLLAGIEAPDAGTVEILGHQLADLSESQRAKLRLHDVGVIYGTHNAIEHLTMRQNMLLPYALNGKKIDEDFLHQVVDRCNLGDYLTKRPRETDPEVHQRMAIGRAILKGARIILADEPTSLLKTPGTENVLDTLRSCAREFNLSVIMATTSMHASCYSEQTLIAVDGSLLGTIDSPSPQSVFLALENVSVWNKP